MARFREKKNSNLAEHLRICSDADGGLSARDDCDKKFAHLSKSSRVVSEKLLPWSLLSVPAYEEGFVTFGRLVRFAERDRGTQLLMNSKYR